jgi:cellulose synthase/poly-beta-1,6-N-acetylglucosamine synthase-like glycosyltransferase
VDIVICHGTRCGRSAAINAAARFASGDLLLTVDADTVFEPTAVARLAAVFEDPRVAGASCNIAISNERESLWTGLQSVEYLMSISAGRSTLDVVDAIACLSGACSMYRRDTFLRQGGLDVGPHAADRRPAAFAATGPTAGGYPAGSDDLYPAFLLPTRRRTLPKAPISQGGYRAGQNSVAP